MEEIEGNKEYEELGDLPVKLQKKVNLLGISDVEDFLSKSIISLNNRSLIQLINESENGNGLKVVLGPIR